MCGKERNSLHQITPIPDSRDLEVTKCIPKGQEAAFITPLHRDSLAQIHQDLIKEEKSNWQRSDNRDGEVKSPISQL